MYRNVVGNKKDFANSGFTLVVKMSYFQREGISISIFDSYDMKRLFSWRSCDILAVGSVLFQPISIRLIESARRLSMVSSMTGAQRSEVHF